MAMQLDCKVYVGNLLPRVTEKELCNEFSRSGPIRKVWVARKPPGFAFIEFETPSGAWEACSKYDGR